jgi:hypothetical protein
MVLLLPDTLNWSPIFNVSVHKYLVILVYLISFVVFGFKKALISIVGSTILSESEALKFYSGEGKLPI